VHLRLVCQRISGDRLVSEKVTGHSPRMVGTALAMAGLLIMQAAGMLVAWLTWRRGPAFTSEAQRWRRERRALTGAGWDRRRFSSWASLPSS
jgi:hypothetical protein